MRQLTCRNGTAELYITTNERLSEPTVRGGPAPNRETFSDSGATSSRDTLVKKPSDHLDRLLPILIGKPRAIIAREEEIWTAFFVLITNAVADRTGTA